MVACGGAQKYQTVKGVFGVFFGVFEPSPRTKIAQIVSLITGRFLELGGRD